MMKIAIVCDVLGPKNNGTTIASYNLIDSLLKKGYEVTVISPDEKILSDAVHIKMPTMDLHFKFLNNYVKKNGVSIAKVDRHTLDKALENIDHVHIMCPFILGGVAAKVCDERGISVSAGFHMQAENFSSHFKLMNFTWVNNMIYRNIRNRVFNHVRSIHYPTKFICDVFSKYKPTAKPYIISNGVVPIFKPMKVERPAVYQDKFVILCSGRYSKEKDQITLLRAVKYSKYKDKIQIILAGDGPMKKKFIKYSKKHNLNPEFSFFSREDLVKTINFADLYVHTAICEIEAIACLEALCCGLVPIIADSKRSATRFFALSENNSFIHHRPKELAQRIDFFIENPAVKKELSKKYLEFSSQQFNLEYCMDKMEEMIIETYNEVHSKA